MRFFVPAFLLFAGVGIVSGWGHREETARKNLYRNIVPRNEGQQYFLRVQCKDQYAFENNVDTQVGKFINREQSINEALKLGSMKPSGRHVGYASLLGAFLGGPAGGITASSLLKDVKKTKFWSLKQLKKTLFGIVGSISGFALGNWISSTYDTKCSSDKAKGLLDDKEMWKKFERAWIVATIKEIQTLVGARFTEITGRNVYPLNDDPITLCNIVANDKVNSLIENVREISRDFISEDFSTVVSFKKKHDRIKQIPAYHNLIRLLPYRITFKKYGKKKFELIFEKMGYSNEIWESLCQQLREIIKEPKSHTDSNTRLDESSYNKSLNPTANSLA